MRSAVVAVNFRFCTDRRRNAVRPGDRGGQRPTSDNDATFAHCTGSYAAHSLSDGAKQAAEQHDQINRI
jgi:hypothetical protein